MIYFAKEVVSGNIKIGHSKWVTDRISQLKTAQKCEVVLLASIDGDQRLERKIHRHLEDHRVSGEWFRPHADVMSFIENAQNMSANLPDLKDVYVGVEEDVIALVAEMADAQDRTTAGQLRHMIRTHPELIGWRSLKSHPEFQAAIAKANPVPAKVEP